MLSLISIISTIPMPWSIEGLFRSALAQSLHDQPPIFATIGLLYDPATTIDVCIAIVVSQRSNNSRIGLLVVCIGANSINTSFVALCSLDFFFLLQSHTSSHLFTADHSIPDLLLHLPPLCSSTADHRDAVPRATLRSFSALPLGLHPHSSLRLLHLVHAHLALPGLSLRSPWHLGPCLRWRSIPHHYLRPTAATESPGCPAAQISQPPRLRPIGHRSNRPRPPQAHQRHNATHLRGTGSPRSLDDIVANPGSFRYVSPEERMRPAIPPPSFVTISAATKVPDAAEPAGQSSSTPPQTSESLGLASRQNFTRFVTGMRLIDRKYEQKRAEMLALLHPELLAQQQQPVVLPQMQQRWVPMVPQRAPAPQPGFPPPSQPFAPTGPSPAGPPSPKPQPSTPKRAPSPAPAPPKPVSPALKPKAAPPPPPGARRPIPFVMG